MKSIFLQDIKYIYEHLSEQELDKLKDSTVLITGCAGSLGMELCGFLSEYSEELNLNIILLDNFMGGQAPWVKRIRKHPRVTIHKFNVITDDISAVDGAKQANYVFHMASIASPVVYRMYPLETIDANIMGLRKLLEFYRVQFFQLCLSRLSSVPVRYK